MRKEIIDYEKQKVIIIEHHPADSRTRIALDQRCCQSLTSRMETEGGNIPLVMIKEAK